VNRVVSIGLNVTLAIFGLKLCYFVFVFDLELLVFGLGCLANYKQAEDVEAFG
jgi:hypothetical protein